uniref:Glycine-rich RNA-binding protein 8 n=2 Tax=Anthurium amnicola TaxID=1678845 RepID=A0A1D1ZKT3_9ARAE
MGGKEEIRIFVGGLSWETTERDLEDAFGRFGKVLEAQIMVERDTGRPRGFGFVTFADRRAMDSAIDEMHGQELSGRVISVNKAEPKVGSDGPGYGYRGSGGGGYSSGGRGSFGGGGADKAPPVGRSDCFKCGRSGHWARDCPSAGSDGGRFPSRPKFGSAGGGGGGRGDRLGGSDRYNDRYMDDRYDGGRYGDRDRADSRDDRYGGGRDRYSNDRYPASGDRFPGDKYGTSDRYPQNGYGKERGYDRDGVSRASGGERYGSGGSTRYEGGGSAYRERPGPYDRPSRGGGAARYEGGGGGYKERPAPYDRPSRGGGRASSFDDRY